MSYKKRLKDLIDTLLYFYQRLTILPDLKHAHKICFLCDGNICRSPFCEHYARKSFDKINLPAKIVSCGFCEKTGRSSPYNAVLAASYFGIDLSGHRSRRLTDEIVESSSLIIGMHYCHLKAFKKRYAHYTHKFYLLEHFAWPRFKLMNISDPYNKTLDDFRQCYWEIKTCIDIGIERGITSIASHAQPEN